jgi:hypothetical protein
MLGEDNSFWPLGMNAVGGGVFFSFSISCFKAIRVFKLFQNKIVF